MKPMKPLLQAGITGACPYCLKSDFLSMNGREKLSLDKGWNFYQGDMAFPVIKGHGMSYDNAKAGKAWGAAAPEFDDTDWREVNLPHDWSVEQPYDSTENLSQGYRKRGFGWYRRNFKLSPDDKGKHLELQFDGIATHCAVWFNGTVVHRNYCGYNSFYIDVTPLAYYGDKENNIAIRVDAVQQEGWWYEGAGIYRHTWLMKRSSTHLVTDGVFAQPIKDASGNWIIPIEATLENSEKNRSDVEVEISLFDKSGKKIVQQKTQASVSSVNQSVAKLTLPVSCPELWTLEQPTLYTIRTTILEKGIKIDSLMTTCGFRTIRFTADSGFYLNDQSVKIKGVCNHQDHAGVGVAVPDAIWDFRLRKLKEMGANACRCAHNPPSAEFLAACDRLGILVMDENRNFNVSPEYVRQLEWLIRRDRNHPSVILWSVFNEEPMQGTENGYEMVRRMSAVVKTLDTTRPVTAAASGGLLSAKNVAHAVDVIGVNYQAIDYDKIHKAFPNAPVTSSEDDSAFMVRGEYVTDKKKCLHDSYDTQHAVWGTNHRNGWKLVDQRPYLAGCFIWTGFDYRGEPQPYEWPAAGASFGIMDQCGFPKAAFYIHQAQWLNKPVLQLIPHWNWSADRIGKPVKVMALTNAETVKLMLNGKLISVKPVDKYEMVEWIIPFKPGKLRAIGYKGGKEVSRFTVETTGEPLGFQIIPDRPTLAGDGYDAMPVTVQAVDAKGRPVPTANLPVEFEISGPGAIMGLGNGNPNSHEAEKGNQRKLFNGLAQVILQSSFNGSGPLVLKAKSAGLKSAEIIIQVENTAQIPSVAVAYPKLVMRKPVEVKVDNTLAWHDPSRWGVEGRGWIDGLTRYYDRLPARAEKSVPGGVWAFSRESSGMSVRFITDATSIHVRYNLLSSNMSHGWGDMSGMSSSGVDLYAQRVDSTSGKTTWRWVGGNKPAKENCNDCLVSGLVPGKRLYVLHLPVYNGVEKLEIGILSNAAFEPVEPRKEPPIVFYGTSIMQGGIASRPGLAIPAVISRHLNSPVINLGFCGSGCMDAPVVELLAEIKAAVYVIDCLPNMDPEMVSQRTEPLVRRLRKAHPKTPILLVESHDYPSPELFPGENSDIRARQSALQAAYDRFVKAGVKNLYYLPGKSLVGCDSEGTGDGTHPNALGMFRYCEAYEAVLRKILGQPTR